MFVSPSFCLSVPLPVHDKCSSLCTLSGTPMQRQRILHDRRRRNRRTEKVSRTSKDRNISEMLLRRENVEVHDDRRETRTVFHQQCLEDLFEEKRKVPLRSADCQLNGFESISERIDRRVIRQIIDPNTIDTDTSIT